MSRDPAEADTEVPAGDGLVLALRGRLLEAEDQRLVGAFAAQAAVVLDRIRLSRGRRRGRAARGGQQVRTALLAAVGHDLRTPLAAAKAAVSSLLSRDVDLGAEDRRDLLQAADESLDRLAALVDNLLDMSRLQAGAMSIDVQPTARRRGRGPRPGRPRPGRATRRDRRPRDLPLVQADPGLLERVLANLVANALRYSPPDEPPHPDGQPLGDRVEIRVIDRGPGIPPDHWDQVFLPFQRLGDTDNTTGIGLGLALSRGLDRGDGRDARARGDTRWGLTMVVSLPAAGPRLRAAPGRRGNGRTEASAVTRVLVVDDEPQILRALSINLRARHYDVRAAATGAEACGRRRPSARPRHPRPRPARHGRHRGDRGAARLDRRTDPGAVRPHRQRRQGRRSRRRRRRLRHQAVRHGRAARPAARHDPAQRRTEDSSPSSASATRPSTWPRGRSTRTGTDVRLTPTEWHLLEVLVRHPGKLLSQRQLLTEVWGPGYETAQGNLRLYMAQLRRKLEPDPPAPATCSTSPAWATGSSRERRDRPSGRALRGSPAAQPSTGLNLNVLSVYDVQRYE